MKTFPFITLGLIAAGTLLRVEATSAGARLQRQRSATGAAAAEKKEPGPLDGAWELTECDNGGAAIGYHPEVKVPPHHALLMFAYMAKNPKKDSDIKGMRWLFTKDKVTVELVVLEDKKKSREKLAEFTYRLDEAAKPRTMNLTWQPPGFEGMVREQRGQVIQGIWKMDGDKLEVVFNHSGKNRPREFKVDRSCYRLVLRKVKK
jgi:uncharacterized protein (TIGR03067 family)